MGREGEADRGGSGSRVCTSRRTEPWSDVLVRGQLAVDGAAVCLTVLPGGGKGARCRCWGSGPLSAASLLHWELGPATLRCPPMVVPAAHMIAGVGRPAPAPHASSHAGGTAPHESSLPRQPRFPLVPLLEERRCPRPSRGLRWGSRRPAVRPAGHWSRGSRAGRRGRKLWGERLPSGICSAPSS